MNAKRFLEDILLPAVAWADRAAGIASQPRAVRFGLAIAGQESEWTHRAQVLASGGAGPARSFWQGEQTGGMILVLKHPLVKAQALALCDAASVRQTPEAVWRAIEGHDGLAWGLARLLIRTAPQALPATAAEGWAQYLDLWRPGAPKPATWPARWAEASALFPGA